MNTKEFIESGILESYVMGQASPGEQQQVQQMMAQFPEVREEVAAIEKALEAYLFSNQLQPRSGSKEKMLAAIEKADSTDVIIPKVVPINKPSAVPGNAFNWFTIAASVALFFSFGMNLYLFSKLENERENMTALRQKSDAFTSELNVQQASYKQLTDEMHMLMMPTTHKVMMKGMEKAPNAMAIVYWNPDSKDVMLNVQALPSAPADMQYQLWAIVDGKPVDAGVFDMSPNAPMIKMKAISGAVAFAVTLEKHGGSPTPTMSQMYVMGKV